MTSISTVAAADLPALATRINDAITAAETHAKSAMQQALAAGALLHMAKAGVQHGAWERWVTEHCKVAMRTAQAYMRLSTAHAALPPTEAQRVADLPVREAIRAISTRPEAPPRPTPARARDRAESDRAAEVLRKCSSAARESAKRIEMLGAMPGSTMLSAAQVQSLRNKLTAAIEALDGLVSDSGGEQ